MHWGGMGLSSGVVWASFLGAALGVDVDNATSLTTFCHDIADIDLDGGADIAQEVVNERRQNNLLLQIAQNGTDNNLTDLAAGNQTAAVFAVAQGPYLVSLLSTSLACWALVSLAVLAMPYLCCAQICCGRECRPPKAWTDAPRTTQVRTSMCFGVFAPLALATSLVGVVYMQGLSTGITVTSCAVSDSLANLGDFLEYLSDPVKDIASNVKVVATNLEDILDEFSSLSTRIETTRTSVGQGWQCAGFLFRRAHLPPSSSRLHAPRVAPAPRPPSAWSLSTMCAASPKPPIVRGYIPHCARPTVRRIWSSQIWSLCSLAWTPSST